MISFNERKLKELLLSNLSIKDERELESWKNDPVLEDEVMCNKFWSYVKQAPAIGIVGDYDCDGICASYIMGKSIMEICPGKKLIMRIPHRFSEGYGINETIRKEFEEKLPKGSVIITVDNGIAAASLLEQFEKDGYVVLMTDHHELREGNHVPDVTFVANPAVPEASKGFSWKKWCGAAVAYKLAERFVSEPLKNELMCYAGLATVADCMELTGANWGLVRNALEAFRQGKGPKALSAMLTDMKQDPLFVNEDAFGFYLGPCFNAPGRLEDNGAGLVLKYLFSPDKDKLTRLIAYNTERKEQRDTGLERTKEKLVAERKVSPDGKPLTCPIWVSVDGLGEGIVGIIAGKLTEEYGVPAIVVTPSKESPDILKGSARSIPGINIFEYLSDMMPLLDKMGGHPGAAGLSLFTENLEKVQEYKLPIPESAGKDGRSFKICGDDIPKIENLLKVFRPFGEGNPAPVFSLDMDLNGKESEYLVGKEEEKGGYKGKLHLLINKRDARPPYKITHFFHYPDALSLKDRNKFELTGRIAGSAFNGIETPTFNAEEMDDIEK